MVSTEETATMAKAEVKPTPIPLPRRRFTVAEYLRMAEAGILGEDDRVELIAGEIIEMSPIGPRHASCVTTLLWLLSHMVTDEVLISVQNPIHLSDESEPQPDLALVRLRNYRQALPTVADIFAVFEVSDSTVKTDRATKLPFYAAAGIAEAWLVDLVTDRVERHTQPGPDGYDQISVGRPGATLESTVVAGVRISVNAALGLDD